MGRAVWSGVEVTALDQLPLMQASTAKYFVMFDLYVAFGTAICLQ